MSKIDIYNQAGKKIGSENLNDKVFSIEINKELMHRALVRQLANRRINLAKAKGRADVRGGGRKPYRQKGTGRARQGTIRAPNMKGGGVVFGPSGKRNFSLNMPKKQRRIALFSALSVKAKEKAIFCLDKYEGDISTKVFNDLLKNLPVERNLLIIFSEKNSVLEKSSRNISIVKLLPVAYLNIADLLKYNKLCFVGDSAKKIEEIFLN